MCLYHCFILNLFEYFYISWERGVRLNNTKSVEALRYALMHFEIYVKQLHVYRQIWLIRQIIIDLSYGYWKRIHISVFRGHDYGRATHNSQETNYPMDSITVSGLYILEVNDKIYIQVPEETINRGTDRFLGENLKARFGAFLVETRTN